MIGVNKNIRMKISAYVKKFGISDKVVAFARMLINALAMINELTKRKKTVEAPFLIFCIVIPQQIIFNESIIDIFRSFSLLRLRCFTIFNLSKTFGMTMQAQIRVKYTKKLIIYSK
jgi:hypothetical protein